MKAKPQCCQVLIISKEATPTLAPTLTLAHSLTYLIILNWLYIIFFWIKNYKPSKWNRNYASFWAPICQFYFHKTTLTLAPLRFNHNLHQFNQLKDSMYEADKSIVQHAMRIHRKPGDGTRGDPTSRIWPPFFLRNRGNYPTPVHITSNWK